MAMNSSKSSTARTLAERDLLEALGELANLRDEREAFERFCKRWPELAYVSDNAPELHPIEETELPTKFWLIYERRGYLRDIWEGDPRPLRGFLLPTDPPEELRDRGIYFDRNSTDMHVGILWETQIELDWRRSEIIYEPRTEFQRAIYTLFRKSALAKVCGNPDCPARYFVARKTTQRYCSAKCAEVFQRASKRKWWAERGDAWRRDRTKPSRKRRGKG
jgi:hypothetical protein